MTDREENPTGGRSEHSSSSTDVAAANVERCVRHVGTALDHATCFVAPTGCGFVVRRLMTSLGKSKLHSDVRGVISVM